LFNIYAKEKISTSWYKNNFWRVTQWTASFFNWCRIITAFIQDSSMAMSSQIQMSRTLMCMAQSSSLGGNKLVPSRTFCPRAVTRGLAEEEKVKGRGGGHYEFSWIFLLWWEDTL
jgi:hypothetical protein